MRERLLPYPDYRPSSEAWLRQVPTHWETLRLKTWVFINAQVLPETTDPDYRFNYVEIGTVSNGSLTDEPKQIVFRDAPSRARRVVRQGDTIISTVRTYLKAVWFAETATNLVCSTGFAVLSPKPNAVPKFAAYLALCDPFIQMVVANSVGTSYPAIPERQFGNIEVPVPPPEEQTTIVRYLDHADELISRYISAKERLIALLEEQRQAVIHQAVTRGLDPNAPSKKSGIEWLDDVPQHWQLPELKQVSKILRGKFTHRPRNDPSLYGGIYPFIQTGDVAAANGIIRTHRQTLNQQGLAVSTMFPAGTLVMTIAANIGDVAVLNFEACFPDSIVGFVPTNKVERDFLYYLFRAMKSEFLREAPVNTQGNLNVERIGSRKIPLPSVDEQVTIVRHLAEVSAHIDASMELAHRQVSLIGEYRTRLIADVVTGQIAVRDAVVELPGQHL